MSKLYNSNKLPFFKDFGKNKVICIDFSSPNIAKNLGFHHIRSTLTGSFLSNLYSKLGYDVKKLNFLGDWGSGIAKLIFGYKYFKCSKEMSIDELHAFHFVCFIYHLIQKAVYRPWCPSSPMHGI